MPISFSRYVEITSAVGGVAQATTRELILRLITQNNMVPTDAIIEFDSADEVGAFFGTTVDDFLQAQAYFAFINKLTTTPSKVSFAFWPEVNTAPLVFGTSATYLVTDFTSISNGSMRVDMGAASSDVTGMDFTVGVTTLADVAGVIQTQIRLVGDSFFTTAVVAFDVASNRFTLVGSDTGDSPMVIAAAASGTPVAPLVGWVLPTAIFSPGIDAETLTETLTRTSQISNNYGSFSFIPTSLLNFAQTTEIATWNDGENIKYIYLQRVLSASAAAVAGNIAALGGTALTLYDGVLTTEFPWLLPASVLASTPYLRRNSVQNYMFQQDGTTALVTDDTTATTFDDINVNYVGNTQQAGQLLSFYQRGVLQGSATDPIDMGVYANEIFLKDDIGVRIMNLFLALPAVPANSRGTAQILTQVQASIELALFNGTISIGKSLTSTQIAFVTTVTGDPNAFLQIQNIGYWIDASISGVAPNLQVDYVLVYAKNDSVKKVEGSHDLL